MSNIIFIGESGTRSDQLLKNLITTVGISLNDCGFINTKGMEDLKSSLPTLIQVAEPKIVVTLGNDTLKALLGHSGIMKYRGQAIDKTFGDHKCIIMPTVSPGSVLMNPKNESLIRADLDNLKAISTGSNRKGEDQKKFKIVWVTNKRKLKACLEALDESYASGNHIAYDLETDVTPLDKSIWLMGISDKNDRAWIIPLQHPESPWVDNYMWVLKHFKKYLESPRFYKVAQNGKFDDRWLRTRGIKPYLNFDTMLAQHLINENAPKGLDFLATVYFNAVNWGKGKIQFENEYNKKGQLLRAITDLKTMGRYCGIDCIYTRKLRDPLRDKLLDDEKTARIFKYITMPASRMLEKVEQTGIYINRKQLGKAYTEACHNANKAIDTLESFVPDDFWERQNKKKPKGLETKINWNSSDQIGSFFFSPKKRGGLGLKVVEMTKGGKASTAEHTMIELEGVHPACDALLEYRKWAKYLNTYIEPWLLKSDNVDSRLHPNFKIYGTVTGRISSEEPNPQQTPRDVFLRSNLCAPKGWTFIEGDYSQIELRVVAFLSGDPRMTRAYQLGEDIHMITACDIMGLTIEQFKKFDKAKQKELRKMAKAVNFGYVYGMWWKKFKKYAKDNYGVEVTDEEAKSHRERFFKLYKGLKPWHDRQQRIVKATKQVRAPHGRIRHLPDIDSEDEGISKEAGRQAINSPVQGFASGDLTLLAAVLFDRIIEKFYDPRYAKITLLVHDAIMWEVKDTYPKKDELIRVFRGVMENVPLKEYFDLDFTIPIVADVQTGQAWGVLKDTPTDYDKKEVLKMVKEVM